MQRRVADVFGLVIGVVQRVEEVINVPPPLPSVLSRADEGGEKFHISDLRAILRALRNGS